MPIYEYVCVDCGAGFEIIHTASGEHDNVKCPDCGGRAGKKFSTFSALAGVDSRAVPLCETTGACPSPNMPGCKTGQCGM